MEKGKGSKNTHIRYNCFQMPASGVVILYIALLDTLSSRGHTILGTRKGKMILTTYQLDA